MKSIISCFVCLLALCIISCSDNDNLDLNLIEDSENQKVSTRGGGPAGPPCSYTLYPELVSNGDDGEPCDTEVRFHFVSDTGEEFDVTYDPSLGSFPEIVLPPGNYSMWITSKGGQSSACGDFVWRLHTENQACDRTFTHFVESRPDLINEASPDYIFTIPEDCGCPPPNCDYDILDTIEAEDRCEFVVSYDCSANLSVDGVLKNGIPIGNNTCVSIIFIPKGESTVLLFRNENGTICETTLECPE